MTTCCDCEKEKTPGAQLDYGFNWGDEWLTGDETIVSAVWTVPDGITNVLEYTTDTISMIWLSGGDSGKTYYISCKITTNNSPPRIDTRILKLKITPK